MSTDIEVDENGIVKIVGSETWRGGYELGEELEERFPGIDGYDFGSAVSYHGYGPLVEGAEILDIKMLVQGENDGKDWIWFVIVRGDSYYDDYWLLRGGCDYTGWDCQSGATWTKID